MTSSKLNEHFYIAVGIFEILSVLASFMALTVNKLELTWAIVIGLTVLFVLLLAYYFYYRKLAKGEKHKLFNT